MKKLTTTLASALAVLLLASGAWAGEYSVADEDLEEFMKNLGDSVQVQDQIVGVHGEGTLDACFLCRPVAYAVSFEHDGNWTPTTDIYWNETLEIYLVNWDENLMTNVDGVRMWWKTSSPACCDYCDWGDWHAEYYDWLYGYTYCHDYWDLCDYGSGDDIIYFGQETEYYDDFDFSYQSSWRDKIGMFDRSGSTNTDSIIEIAVIPE